MQSIHAAIVSRTRTISSAVNPSMSAYCRMFAVVPEAAATVR